VSAVYIYFVFKINSKSDFRLRLYFQKFRTKDQEGLDHLKKVYLKYQTNQHVTIEFQSVLYYAAPVWLTPSLLTCKSELRRLESIPYRSLRLVLHDYRQEMGLDPTWAYLWPAINKRPTCLWPGYFLTQPKEIFLTWREKIKKFDVFRENFPNPNHRCLTRPVPTIARKNWPNPTQVKKFWLGPITTTYNRLTENG